MNLIYNILYFYQRKILPGFKVKESDLVVDIGSGDKPFWRADVFVDDLSLGDVQRASETKTIHDIGKFVNANVMNLPFENKFFDFSFCSHLLEHVDDPHGAISEITRVSKAGYIEMPNGIIESVKPFVSHIWFVYKNGKKLIFVRKSKKIHEVLSNNDNNFFSVISKARNPFIRYYWKNNIECEVIDEFTENEKYHSPLKLKEKIRRSSNNYYIFMVKIIRKFFYVDKNIYKEIHEK